MFGYMNVRVAALAAVIALAAGVAVAAPAAVPASVQKTEALVAAAIGDYDDGAFVQAIARLQEALEQDPRNAKGLYYLANAYWRLEDYDRATDAFNRLLKADPRGPFAEDAREWLAAQGSFDVIASRIKVQPYTGGTTKIAGTTATVSMLDGRTRIVPPAGWTKAADEEVKDAGGGEIYRLAFRRDLGSGTPASLIVEAHHMDATPAPSSGRKAVAGLSEITDRILAELGVDDYQVTRSKALDAGQEFEFASDKLSGVQGVVRGVWDGTSLLIAVSMAPKTAWGAVGKQLAASVGSFRTSPGTAARKPGATATASAAASPAPARTPGLSVPTMYQRQPGDPTLPPALYPAPWATSTP